MKPYYHDEASGITIYHGDCREIEPQLEYDLIVTDPPYGTGQKIAYDVYRDTMANWRDLAEWLTDRPVPLAFTISHSRLLDLGERRPQWIGCWDKVFTSGIVHVGASPTWEPICFYGLPQGDRGKPRWDDIFRCPVAGFPFHEPQIGHPCPKPVQLFAKLLKIMPEGTVLDPFMGSGSCLRAAKDANRRAVGIDLSERYCEIAAKRLAQGVLLTEATA